MSSMFSVQSSDDRGDVYECPVCKKFVPSTDINLKFNSDKYGYVSLWENPKDNNPFPKDGVLLVCSKCKD